MPEDKTFEAYSSSLGFEHYPFNSFTAENERDRQQDLFVSTQLYSPLHEAFDSGNTMILSGDRGTGKTATTYDFIRRSKSDTLLTVIDDFSDLNPGYTPSEFYCFVLENIVNVFFENLAEGRYRLKNATEDERVLLTYYFINFASDATKGIARKKARDLQVTPFKKFLVGCYNFFRNPLNLVSNAGANILADIVAKSIGTSQIELEVREYFPEISALVKDDLPRADVTLSGLRRFLSIIKKLGVSRVSIILDKIDEDPRFENAAEDIADFLEPIVTDNKFLLDENIQTIISTWVVPMNFLRDKVRTQKIHSPEIRWEHADLRKVFDRRVNVFSNGKAKNFHNSFAANVSAQDKDELLELSNRNPRDLWHLMDRIFRAQYRLDSAAATISKDAIKHGITDFVKNFNFYEYYPRKANARANSMDVYAYIRHLLRLEDVRFTRNQLNEKAGTGSSTLNYTVGMENLGLVEKDVSEKGENSYRIRDPKIRYALVNSIEIAKP